MSEITTNDRDAKSGRFLSGCKPGPGRQPGSRNKLAEAFIADLVSAWNEHGTTALRRCAQEEPGTFLRIVASLMPRDVNLSIGIDVASFADKFAAAAELLGHDIDPPRLRRPLRRAPPLIEHNDA
jgi:hypothetical protein